MTVTSYPADSLFRPAVVEGKQETSQKAAALKLPKTGADRLMLLEYISRRSETGATDIEMEQRCQIKGSSQRPRRGELAKWGYIEQASFKREGCTVWRINDAGRTILGMKLDRVAAPKEIQ